MFGFVKRPSRMLVPIVIVAVLAMSSLAAAASSWTIVPSPNPGTANSINGLVAVSPTEIWGVGNVSSQSYTGCHGRTLTSRWNGTAFVEVPSTPTSVCAAINGVAGRSTTDIWAVGSASNGRDTHLRHWNGTTWTTVAGAVIQVPPSGGRRQRSTALNAVTALSGTNVWAVGGAEYADFTNNTLIEHWNGQAWTLVSAPAASGSVLRGVAAVGPSDIWAVGSGGASGSATLATLVEHWNGSRWTVVPSPNANKLNFLRGVATVSANNVWAVGDSVKDPFDGASVYRTLIEHWNGTSWTVVPSPNIGAGNNSLAAIAARAANDIWAVGYFDDITGSIPIRHTFIQHWNGTAWSVVASPNAGTGDNWLTSVVAPAGTTQAFASGISASGTLVERFAG
ncbi:MAG: hypothetical protein QOI55_1895 [Actinomycetota bacterium]|nr:hypothetical protein [Actinomycetota bacterium]